MFNMKRSEGWMVRLNTGLYMNQDQMLVLMLSAHDEKHATTITLHLIEQYNARIVDGIQPDFLRGVDFATVQPDTYLIDWDHTYRRIYRRDPDLVELLKEAADYHKRHGRPFPNSDHPSADSFFI